MNTPHEATMLGTLRIRDYRLLLTGQLLSSTRNWLLLVAAPFFVFRLTGSTMATGLSMAAETVPAILLGPVAGVFVDRWDRRWTMIATDALRAGAVLLLLLVHSRLVVWSLDMLPEATRGVRARGSHTGACATGNVGRNG